MWLIYIYLFILYYILAYIQHKGEVSLENRRIPSLPVRNNIAQSNEYRDNASNVMSLILSTSYVQFSQIQCNSLCQNVLAIYIYPLLTYSSHEFNATHCVRMLLQHSVFCTGPITVTQFHCGQNIQQQTFFLYRIMWDSLTQPDNGSLMLL